MKKKSANQSVPKPVYPFRLDPKLIERIDNAISKSEKAWQNPYYSRTDFVETWLRYGVNKAETEFVNRLSRNIKPQANK